jgi:hypothetical protein
VTETTEGMYRDWRCCMPDGSWSGSGATFSIGVEIVLHPFHVTFLLVPEVWVELDC